MGDETMSNYPDGMNHSYLDDPYTEQQRLEIEEYKDFLFKRAELTGVITNLISKLYEEYSVDIVDLQGGVEEMLEALTSDIEYELKTDVCDG